MLDSRARVLGCVDRVAVLYTLYTIRYTLYFTDVLDSRARVLGWVDRVGVDVSEMLVDDLLRTHDGIAASVQAEERVLQSAARKYKSIKYKV